MKIGMTLVAVVLVATACSSSTPSVGDEGNGSPRNQNQDDGGGGGPGPDGAAPTPDGGSSPTSCSGDQTQCPKGCFDLKTDLNNCGSCGSKCDRNCVAGECRGGTDCAPITEPFVGDECVLPCPGGIQLGACAETTCAEVCEKEGKECLESAVRAVSAEEVCGTMRCNRVATEEDVIDCPEGEKLEAVCLCQ